MLTLVVIVLVTEEDIDEVGLKLTLALTLELTVVLGVIVYEGLTLAVTDDEDENDGETLEETELLGLRLELGLKLGLIVFERVSEADMLGVKLAEILLDTLGLML